MVAGPFSVAPDTISSDSDLSGWTPRALGTPSYKFSPSSVVPAEAGILMFLAMIDDLREKDLKRNIRFSVEMDKLSLIC